MQLLTITLSGFMSLWMIGGVLVCMYCSPAAMSCAMALHVSSVSYKQSNHLTNHPQQSQISNLNGQVQGISKNQLIQILSFNQIHDDYQFIGCFIDGVAK